MIGRGKFVRVEMVIFFMCVLVFVLFVGILILGKLSYAKRVELLVPSPGACYSLKKVLGNRVYFEKGVSCSGSLVVSVGFDKLYDVIEIYADGNLWKRFTPGNSLEGLIEYSYTLGESLHKSFADNFTDVTKNETLYRKAERMAKDVYAFTQSEDYKRKIERYKEYIVSGNGSFYSDYVRLSDNLTMPGGLRDSGSKREGQLANVVGLRLDFSERVYVFISSSIPVDVLRAYFRQAESFGSNRVVFVLQGVIGDPSRLGPTVSWLYNLMKKDPDCDPLKTKCDVYNVNVWIDPLLFRKYGIRQVPAVVYVRGLGESLVDIHSEGVDNVSFEKAYISFGDASLYHHMYVLGKEAGRPDFVELAKRFIRY